MKILKGLLLILGLVALIVGTFFLIRAALDVEKLVGIVDSEKHRPEFSSTASYVWMSSAFAAVSGLLIGLGLGMPRQLHREEESLSQLSEAEQRNLDHQRSFDAD